MSDAGGDKKRSLQSHRERIYTSTQDLKKCRKRCTLGRMMHGREGVRLRNI